MQTIGKYVLTRQLGAGGMGVVYEGHDAALNRAVAIKVLPPASGNETSEEQLRFRREAEAAAKVNHPNCVQIYDFGEEGGRPFLVMELVPGANAGALVARAGRLAWVKATRIAAAACKGLAAIHATGLIHRDVKPSNLLISDTGAVKIADFGLARKTGEVTLSLTGDRTIGTPNYMSPEQCMNEPVDARADVYAMGAAYFHLLTGRPPFTGEHHLQVMFAHCNNPVPDPRSLAPELPDGCAEIVFKAMAKRASDRYQTMGEMLAALVTLLKSNGQKPPQEVVKDQVPLDLPPEGAPTSELTPRPSSQPTLKSTPEPELLSLTSTAPVLPTLPESETPRPSRRKLLFALPAVAVVVGAGGYAAVKAFKRKEEGGPQPSPNTRRRYRPNPWRCRRCGNRPLTSPAKWGESPFRATADSWRLATARATAAA